jgi:hypothetical protein
MIWSAWKTNKVYASGAGYGFSVLEWRDNQHFFKTDWQDVIIELPSGSEVHEARVNLSKSFLHGDCHELRSKAIGRWLLSQGCGAWENRANPRFEVERRGQNRFRVLRRLNA